MKEIETKRLETKRLILRKFEESDYKGMFDNWASDYEVTKYIRFTPHKDFEDTKKVINRWINKYDASSFNWVV